MFRKSRKLSSIYGLSIGCFVIAQSMMIGFVSCRPKNPTSSIITSKPTTQIDIKTDQKIDAADEKEANVGKVLQRNEKEKKIDAEDCDARIAVDLSAYSEAGEALEVVYRFYGSSDSAVMAIGLPKYQHGLLNGIIVVGLPTGRVLARKGIIPSVDILEDETLRPILLDNLSIKGDKKIAILFELSCATCETGYEYRKFEMKESEVIQFDEKFQNRSVYSVSSSRISPQWIASQVSPLIIPRNELEREEKLYYRSSGHKYSLRKTEFRMVGVESCYITDVLGNILAKPGQEFNRVTEFPDLICYRPIENVGFVRSFLRNW